MNTLQWIILVTSINGILAFAGALTLILPKTHFKKVLLYLVSFATGALLGGAFFHLIPESLEKLTLVKTTILLFVGFILFFLIEKVLHWHHCHEDGHCDRHPYTYLTLYGDAVHNFIDGLIIAASFIVSIPIGITTSLLVLLHEFPQEIGDFGILIYGGFTKKRALLYNFLAQTTSVIGGVLGFYFLRLNDYSIFLLPIAAGGFIYISVMDLIPEIFKQRDKVKLFKNIIAFVLGLLLLVASKFLIG